MAIPVVKGSKQEMNGIGDIGKAVVLTGQQEEKVIPEDCPFTCDIKYFIDHPTEYKVNVDGKIGLRKKSTRDYAIGAILRINGDIPLDFLILVAPSNNIRPNEATLISSYNDVYEEWEDISNEFDRWTVTKKRVNWTALLDPFVTQPKLPIYEASYSRDLEAVIAGFLEYVHAEIRTNSQEGE